MIRFVTPGDGNDVVETIDSLVEERNGWPRTARREHQIAIDTGIAPHLRIIYDRVIGQIVGCIEATPDRLRAHHCELGFWVGQPFRNNGYVTEAVQLLVPELFREGRQTVTAATANDNHAVIRLLDNCGFDLVDQRLHVLPNGTVIDAKFFEQHQFGR